MGRSIHEWIATGSVSESIAEQRGYTELVRCKDCRMGEEDTDFYGKPCIICHNPANGVGHVSHDPNWFCADGKVKE